MGDDADIGFLGRLWRRITPIDLAEHRNELIAALEDLQDALLRVERGSAARRTTQIAAKLGTASAITSAMFGSACLFGTASTGTAIGALSGAAFTSAALAWLGGSVAVGSAFVFVVPLVGGVAAYAGAKWAWRKLVTGKPRKDEDLDSQEWVIAKGIDSLLVSLDKDKQRSVLSSYAFFSFWQHTMKPIIVMLTARLDHQYGDWPVPARRRLRKAIGHLKKLRRKGAGRLATSMSVPIGIVSATAVELLAGGEDFSPEQELVFEAFRRSSNFGSDFSPEDIGAYLRDLPSNSRDGVVRNVKGIYHEMKRVQAENSDGDEWSAELMMSVNEPGADITLLNNNSGEIVVRQLKAVSSPDEIYRHLRRYPGIEIEATEEQAANTGVPSSGFSNEDLSREVSDAFEQAKAISGSLAIAEDALEAGFNAAFVTLAFNIGGALATGRSVSEAGGESVKLAASSFKWAAATSALAYLFT